VSQASIEIVCPHCTAINRLSADASLAAAKCGKCHLALQTGKPVNASTQAFDRFVTRNELPVVVDFWAAWCGPCRGMAPVYERAAAKLEDRFRFLKVDTEAEPELAARYQIRAIPTLMLFRKGNLIAQRAGAVDGATLEHWLLQQHPA
jgi:thioredoxin 2